MKKKAARQVSDPCAGQRQVVNSLTERLNAHVVTVNALTSALNTELAAMNMVTTALQSAQNALRTCLGG